MRALYIFSGICALLLLLAIVSAQEIVNDDEVNRVAERLYCPTCANQALAVCATQTCQQWREEVRRQLGAGISEEEVIANFVSLYGVEVLGTPEDSTGQLLTYLPLIVVIAIAVWVVVRNRKRQPHV